MTQDSADPVLEFFDRKRDGFFIEVGACAPFEQSQTWPLEAHGWSGILVEPVPESCAALRENRPRSQVFQVACGAPDQRGQAVFHVAKARSHSGLHQGLVVQNAVYERTENVEVCTLDDVIIRAGNPKIDFVSIDVEGTQLDVLKGFDLAKHRPRLLLVEDHLFNWNTHRYMTSLGLYKLAKRVVRNNWYMPKNQPFKLTSPGERFDLFRKVWLSTPLRMLKRRMRK